MMIAAAAMFIAAPAVAENVDLSTFDKQTLIILIENLQHTVAELEQENAAMLTELAEMRLSLAKLKGGEAKPNPGESDKGEHIYSGTKEMLEDIPEEVRTYSLAMVSAKIAEVNRLQRQVEQAQQKIGEVTATDRRERRDKIAVHQRTMNQARQDLAQVRRSDEFPTPILTIADFEIGAVGRIDDRIRMEILQVIDDGNALVRVGRDTTIWLSGVNVANRVDGERVSLKETVAITESRRYETAIGGSRTVFVMEPRVVDMEKAQAFAELLYAKYQATQ
ncbi:MAG: hypothetical protein WD294_15035 [Phycisphaeraceae bacterium]